MPPTSNKPELLPDSSLLEISPIIGSLVKREKIWRMNSGARKTGFEGIKKFQLTPGHLRTNWKIIEKMAESEQSPKQIVAAGYDRVADQYARLEAGHPWPRMQWVQKLIPHLSSNAPILDLGCGSGEPVARELAPSYQFTGVDISAEQISRARLIAPDGQFLVGDAASVTFPAVSFQAVLSFYTFEHIPREEHSLLLARIHRWLQPEGFLLLSLEAGEVESIVSEWLGTPMFFSCFDPDTMKKMIQEAGFVILETAIETQFEQGTEIPYLWVLAQKKES